MIDTLRFKIIADPELFVALKKKSNEISKKTSEYKDRTPICMYSKEVEIGSYDYHINIFVPDEIKPVFYIEFSAPKVLYGHNIYLLYPNKVELVLQKVKNQLEEYFGKELPPYSSWNLQRLDICYAWRFENQEDAFIGMLILSGYEYSRKGKSIHDTGFKFHGAAYDLKVYMKYEEFMEHDYKRILKYRFNQMNYEKTLQIADELADLARGVLRIEVSMRKEQLTYLFGEEPRYTELLDTNYLISCLNTYFGKMVNKSNSLLMSYQDAINKIFNALPPRKAWTLVTFYNFIYPTDKMKRRFNRRLLKDKRHRSTISRRFKDLAMLGIGIPDEKNNLSFDFKIPSEFVVNREEDLVAEATVLSSSTEDVLGKASEGKSRARA